LKRFLNPVKKPLIEYALLGLGGVIFVVSLFTSFSDDGPYLVSAIISLLVFLPFCLPWHKMRHPIAFLASLIVPILGCIIAIPPLIRIYDEMRGGKDVFADLPASIFIGFLNIQLLVLGTLLLMAYAAFQTAAYLKSRTA
jgi:hypothetical protein